VGQQKVRNETDQSDAVIHAIPDMAAVSPEIISGQGKNTLLKIKKLKTRSAQKFETDESATLSTPELQRLVLIEQLKTTRIQRNYYLDKLKRSGTIIEEDTLQLD
jgi:hypothetical protein